MKYQDIILEVFKTEDKVYLEEGIAFSPFLAFSVFKDKMFNKVKKVKNKGDDLEDKVKSAAKDVKAKGKIFKEKARYEFGVNSGDTVYKLTPEQKEIIKEMYAKYGYDLIKDINQFRRNVLAPYALLKRYVKKNQRVSSEDITGMTKEQFISALESGRKKIEARGEVYKEKSKELQRKLQKYNEELASYRRVKEGIKNGEVNNNILNKLYKELELTDKDLQGYTLEELKAITSRIKANALAKKKINDKKELSADDYEAAAKLRQDQKELRSGKIDLTKDKEFTRKGNFSEAIGKYLLRQDIKKGLINDKDNPFRDSYISIINKLMEGVEKRRKKTLDELISLKKSTEFNDREKKIWEKRPTVKYDSNKISDYYQKIKEEDFLSKPITIEKDPKVKEAEQKIKKEIKNFEEKLKKKVDPTDLEKLKKYKLINDVLTVKDLEDPNKLFKSEEEIKKLADTKSSSSEDEKYISPEEYIRKVKEMSTREYDSIGELNKAKKEVERLTDIMKKNKENEAVDKVKDIIDRFMRRRDLEKQNIIGHKTDVKELVSIKDIENMLQKMINKNYNDFDEYKQDKEILDKAVRKFKNDNADSAEELEDIQYLFDRLENKMKRGI